MSVSTSTHDGHAPLPDDPPPSLLARSKTLQRMLAAFVYRDFRVQWFGACTSSIGTWVQMTAQNWLVQSLTVASSSALFLGLDSFLQQLPVMLFTLVGGVLADRRDRRRTLLGSQYVQMGTAIALALLVYFDVVTIAHILLLSFITGLAQAFGGPAYQSLLPQLVGPKELTNAVALNSIQVNIARVLGPLIFAATLSAVSIFGISSDSPRAMAACFGLNAISFLVVISTLQSLRITHIPPAQQRSIREDLGLGITYVREHPVLIALTVLAATTTFLGYSVLTFLPIFARHVFGGDASTYSHLLAFSGAGSIVGALIIAWLGKFPRMGLAVLLLQALYGCCIVAVATSRTLWLTEILLFFTGASLMVVFSSVTSLVQLIAPNEMRGRVMSIYMVAFRGGMPLGALASGWAATYVSAPTVLQVNGGLLVLVAMYFIVRSHGVRDL